MVNTAELGVGIAKSRVEKTVVDHASRTRMIGQSWGTSTSATSFRAKT